jgi:hypothetical protein
MDLSPAETKAIKALEKVAKTWPPSLLLFSASGTLVVMSSDDYIANVFDSERMMPILGIPNDGGDPDWIQHS